MQYPQLFIDSDGVERGYYVYAHKCEKSGEIFYVGKGKEDRAWNEKRSNAWKEFVGGIGGKYEVLLLHKDLTEDEAIDLEREEIAANGGASAEGGRLVNWIPGEAGDGFGVAIKVDINLGITQTPERERIEQEGRRLYNDVRRFKKLARQEVADLEESYKCAITKSLEPIEKMYWDTFHAAKWEASFSVTSTYNQNTQLLELCRKIANRKMKWMDFCEEMDSLIDGYGVMLNGQKRGNGTSKNDLALCESFFESLKAWSSVYADGTLRDAHIASDGHWIKFWLTDDSDFQMYVSGMRRLYGDQRADDCLRIREGLNRRV